MALKTMPIAKLQQLKSQVEAAITAKVTERRRELESELSKLAGFGGGGKASKFGRGGRMGSVPPKYRNPENQEAIGLGCEAAFYERVDSGADRRRGETESSLHSPGDEEPRPAWFWQICGRATGQPIANDLECRPRRLGTMWSGKRRQL
jgi:hypothetical protein